MQRLKDRRDAGRCLAGLLADYRGRPDCLVIGLPRGGVVVGYEIAQELGLPLDVCVVRKLGVPFQPELAMGALAMGGVCVLHHDVIDGYSITPEEVEREKALELVELARRERAYRGDRPPPALEGKIVILADDGLATGATAEAALGALKRLGASRVVVAVGVASADTLARFRQLTGRAVAVLAPRMLSSIGEWYEDFRQTTDAEVCELLQQQRPIGASSTGQ